MDKHRLSYLKMTLLALLATVIVVAVLFFFATAEHITVLGTAWTPKDHLLLFCPSVILLGAVALLFFAIALGGMICLYGDAKERARIRLFQDSSKHVNAETQIQ
jgi:hypothetical protein